MATLNNTCVAKWNARYGPPNWPPSAPYAQPCTGTISFNANGSPIMSSYQNDVAAYFNGMSQQLCINPTDVGNQVAKATQITGNWSPSANYNTAIINFQISTTGVTGAQPNTTYTAEIILAWEDPEPANGQPDERYWEIIYYEKVSTAAAAPSPRALQPPVLPLADRLLCCLVLYPPLSDHSCHSRCGHSASRGARCLSLPAAVLLLHPVVLPDR
jgi:hypothetical protein